MSCEKVSIFFPNLFEAGMGDRGNRTYQFKSYLLVVGERQLFNGDREVPLTPKTFDVLVHLVENAGRLVHKDDLMKAVWPDSFVEEVNIPRAIHHLRRILGQDKNGNRFIETVPTKGYRFTVPVVCGEIAGETGVIQNGELFGLSSSDSVAASLPAEIDPETERGNAWPRKSSLYDRPILLLGSIAIFLVLGSFWFGGRSPASGVDLSALAPPTNNSLAYRLYLEGKFLLDRRYKGDDTAALAKFDEALSLDASFALAFAGKADAEWRVFHGLDRAHDDIAKARASINKALSLDPNSSYAHTLLCRMNTTYDWDFAGAEKACRRAVELDPSSHDARHEFAMLLNQFGRHEEAMAQMDTAIGLSPTSFNKRQRAMLLFYARRYDEGIAVVERIRESDPEFPKWSNWSWWFYAMNADHEKALEAYLDGQAGADSDLRSIYSSQGWAGVQRAIVRRYEPGDTGGVHAAALHCQLGDRDRSFTFLESELKKRTLWMIHLKADPRFDPCRDDPRFDGMLERIGLK